MRLNFAIRVFCLAITLLCIAHGSLSAKSSATSPQSMKQNKKKWNRRFLLPKMVPHPDICYLIEFVADGSDHCDQMRPVVERLEEDLGTTVRRININRKREYLSIFEACGGNECGNVPFYFNRRTAQAICGATPYANLRSLATGNPSHLFVDTPQNLREKAEYDPRKNRDIGLKDFLLEKFVNTGRSKKQKKKSDLST